MLTEAPKKRYEAGEAHFAMKASSHNLNPTHPSIVPFRNVLLRHISTTYTDKPSISSSQPPHPT